MAGFRPFLEMPTGTSGYESSLKERNMPTIALRAHYDGKQIVLDESFDFAPDTQLLVTVLSPVPPDEKDSWSRLSLENLARAYGDDEPEYSLEDIVP